MGLFVLQASLIGAAAAAPPESTDLPGQGRSQIDAAGKHRPHAEAMAEAWRHRDAGRWLQALVICERLLQRDPGDPSAYRLRTLALADGGAAHRAWELHQARPDLFDPALSLRLQADHVARLVVWGALQPRSPSTRLDEMRLAHAELTSLLDRLPAAEADTARRLRNDELMALNELGRHDRVVDAYLDSQAREEPLPAYVGTAVGDSLLGARRPDLAVPALEQTLARDPGAHNARVLLVYAYVESEQFDKAYALLEKMRADEPAWVRSPGARQDHANWRRYDADVTRTLVESFANALVAAQAQAEALVSIAPLNPDLHQALGSVYLQRGWAARGLERHRVARTIEPANPAPRVGEIQALLDLERTVQARPLLAELLRLHPENIHAQSTARRWERRQGAQVALESSWGRNTGDGATGSPGASPLGSRDASHLLRVASPLIDDAWRVTAHAGAAHADFQGERVRRERGGIGLDFARDRLAWGAEASVPTDRYDRGTSLGGYAQWRFNDVLSARVGAWSNDPTASLQARRSGITADTMTLGLAYRPNELGAVDLGVQQLRFDDGNRRDVVSLSTSRRLLGQPRFLLDAFGGLYASRSSRADAPYFNPASDASVEAGLRADQVLWRHYERHFRHRLALSATHYRQEGFGSTAYPALRYEHEWQLAVGRQVTYSIHYSRPVYDGVREDRVGFDLRASWGE